MKSIDQCRVSVVDDVRTMIDILPRTNAAIDLPLINPAWTRITDGATGVLTDINDLVEETEGLLISKDGIEEVLWNERRHPLVVLGH